MFNKTRHKIIAAVMVSLILLLAITLCVIYISSYSSIRSRDREMLKRYAEMYTLENKLNEAEPAFPDAENPTNGVTLEEIGENGQKPAPPEGPSENMRGRNERIFDLSTFYSVAFSDSGEVLYVDRGKTELFAEDELIELAEEILEKNKAEGEISGLMYVKTDKHNCTLVAFMDNTLSKGSMNTLLRYTLIAGGAAIVVLFFISRMLAKRIVKPLEENDERQKQFVSDAGHELKTPVAVINTNTELLSREIGENEWLSNIKYENERMGVLIKELLDLSHAENAKIPMEQVDLSRLVTGEVLPFESVAFEKGLILQSNVEDGIFTEGNPAQLRQLTAILLDNAIRHSKGDNEIYLALNKDHRAAILKVENSGDDIPPSVQEHLFERFYRVDEARTGDSGGYGLGLAIAKAITEVHGGTIGVSSGGGRVIFTVNLPLKKII